jgi:hypothetical protein
MASYSTNLRLTLLDTGEGAGTWGITTNANMGTLLEQAISGYDVQTLTSGTTLTLTIPDDGASAVARNMYLEFDGTGSTVIVPSNKKLYFVSNNCSSGTITFKVAGGTGVSIPKGDKQILVSDGTDVVQATTYIVNNAASATITNFTATSATITAASITGLATTSATISNLSVSNVLNINTSGTQITSEVLSVRSTTSGLAATFKQELGAADSCVAFWNNAGSGNNNFLAFGTDAAYTVRGSVSYNRGAGQVAYNTTSDRRAKTIYGPVTNSGEIVDQLNVYTGKMNWGDLVFPMLLADEAQQVTPYCVTGDPNAVDPQGNPIYQQMDYSALVPLLLAEIQSLRTRVAALEQE